MSCDKLVFDLSQEVEGSPNVFVRKDWINILDNQNQNYQNNQSIIDTSQLSNSNKYMGYREAYLSVPLLLTIVAPNITTPASTAPIVVEPTAAGVGSADYAIGLKNWFGNIIHSFTLDYNGTTIIQQTPFCNMWNSFKLMTSLSYNDIITQGSTIGFYPDTTGSFFYIETDTTSTEGQYVCNSNLAQIENSYSSITSSVSNVGATISNIRLGGNYGLTKRISWINYNPLVSLDGGLPLNETIFMNSVSCNQVWKSYISQQLDSTIGAAATPALMQISVMATIYLKHIHSFFNMCPLLKGSFMKMTMNLNNATTIIELAPEAGAVGSTGKVNDYRPSSFVGGINPLLIPSGSSGNFNVWKSTVAACTVNRSVYYNISVGATLTDSTVRGLPGASNLTGGQLSKSVYLYVPAYTFNPTFEQAYLSVSPKVVKYTDIYQYQVLDVKSQQTFNNLISNGIANIKSVLIIPFFNKTYSVNPGVYPIKDYVEYLSPFDPAGSTSTAPMVALGNFNVQISGQNAIYNMQRYSFEEFNNQLYGQFAVNGGLTDGLTSGLIDFDAFQKSNCYYYVNVERMLPVEQSVPKSVQILGQNYSQQSINLWVFVEYGVSVSIDILTGARV